MILKNVISGAKEDADSKIEINIGHGRLIKSSFVSS